MPIDRKADGLAWRQAFQFAGKLAWKVRKPDTLVPLAGYMNGAQGYLPRLLRSFTPCMDNTQLSGPQPRARGSEPAFGDLAHAKSRCQEARLKITKRPRRRWLGVRTGPPLR